MPKLYYILVFILTFFNGFGQDLCNTLPAGAVWGSFDVNATSGCSPFTVNITDKSGGTNIKYYYEYQGGGLSEIASTSSTTATSYPYLASTAPIVFTILQVGQKGGKDMYACKNVTVRPNNQPVFSYNSCNNSRLEIIIPTSPFNDFDSYKIDWGIGRLGGGQVETIPKTALPYKQVSNYSTNSPTKVIKVEGFYTVPNGCPAPSAQTVNMGGGSSQPLIKSLEVLSDNKNVKIILEGGIGKIYDLYQRSSTNNYTFGVTAGSFAPGTYTVPLLDTLQTCYLFFNGNGCQEITGEVCTVRLDTIEVNLKNNVLEWKEHPSTLQAYLGGGIYDTKIQSISRKIIKKELPSTSVIIDNPSNPYTDIGDCKKTVCYQIETTVQGVRAGSLAIPYVSKSLSAIKCLNRKNFHPPAITDAFVSVNNSNKVEINYSDNSGWSLNKDLFRLQRENTPNFVSIDSTTTLISPWFDATASPDKQSYCYQINYTDECGSTSLPSPVFCTTYLSSKDNKTLDWTIESPFASSLFSKREIIFLDEITKQPMVESTYPDSTVSNHLADLEHFEEWATYSVKTISKDGKESFSNTFLIPIEANVFLPTAFSPNGDDKNDILEIKGHKKRITFFELSITSRWGERVFYTKDKDATWDGTFKEKPLPSDIYYYTVYFETNTGEKINKKGYIWLLR